MTIINRCLLSFCVLTHGGLISPVDLSAPYCFACSLFARTRCFFFAHAQVFLQILIGLTHFASASVSVRYVCCDNWAQSEIIHGALRHGRAALFALCLSDRTSPHVPLRTCLYLTTRTAPILSVGLHALNYDQLTHGRKRGKTS